MASREIFILWSPQAGPICAYKDGRLAYTHALTMVGVDVSRSELHDDLPEHAREDIASDYDGDDTTPLTVNDLDDKFDQSDE